MKGHEVSIPAGEFKARCLQLMSEVNAHGLEVTITKHGRPVARLVPFDAKSDTPAELFGSMAGMATITGGLVAPLEEAWDAER